jgi:SNF2 family DNA or RNA helicase
VLIHTEKKAVLLKLRNPAKVTTVIPTAVQVQYKGAAFVAVPHRPDETRVLRNLGFSVPDPMPIHYSWPKVSGRHDPFMAQRDTASFMAMHSRAFVLNGMGTGKTNSALWAYDYLRSTKQATKMLVVCPLSTMERAWADSVFSTFPHLDCVVLHGTKERRLKLLAQDVHIYVINIDGVEIIKDALAQRTDIDVVTLDELALARNASTDRWKALNLVCNKQSPRRVWGMTGSPTPNAPTDAWAQCKLVTPDNRMLPKYFGGFRDQVMRQISPFKWIARQEANDVVSKVMQPAIRFSLDDCVDLPEQVFVSRDVPLTPEQAKAYKDMMTNLSTEYKGGQILAVNEAVKANKLIQIACGVAYDTTGNNVVIPSKPRMDVLKEIIEESEGKVIVFVPLTGALESIAAELSKPDFTQAELVAAKLESEYAISDRVAVVHGGTSKGKRDEIFRNFQSQATPSILVANAGTMSHGLTLTEATTIVWYAPVNSNETYEQACARVRRPGQTRATVIVHLAGSDIERRAYKRLQAKQSMQGLLLDLMKEINPEEAVS